VNGPPQFQGLEEIHVLNTISARLPGSVASPLGMGAHAGNFLGQAYLRHVTGLAAFDQAQCALRGQPANGLARRAHGKVDITGQPWNRKPQPPLTFQAAVPHEMGIDHVVDNREA